jgi:UDP-glucuronate 4-epimerase
MFQAYSEVVSRFLITGGAGFIGSHTVVSAVDRGHDVIAVDSFSPYYDLALKKLNAEFVLLEAGITVRPSDLLTDALDPMLEGVDAVIHLAGQPGVRQSWSDFDSYVQQNVAATNRLLEACSRNKIPRVVYASSSSVYGNALRYPVVEGDPTIPFSPYGVTKLAAEHLVRAYSMNFGIRSVCLRYFTVYGPRQRPDMAFNRLIESALTGREFVLHGDGSQIRDFTYVGDVVNANVLAAESDLEQDLVLNVSGGSAVTMNEVIVLVEELAGCRPNIRSSGTVAGDVFRTGGDNGAAFRKLSWQPTVDLRFGVSYQLDFQRNHPRVGN